MPIYAALAGNVSARSAPALLALLLLGDLVLLVLHTVNALTPWLNHGNLSIHRDQGLPELYQYLKWLGIVVLLAYLSRQWRFRGYAAWALLFGYLLCDDAFSIHEHAGGYIAGLLQGTPPWGLRLQDLGELAATGIAAGLLFIPLAAAVRKGPDEFRRVSRGLFLLLLALAFFGVALDMVHTAMRSGWKADFLLGFIEDGGEMGVASLILGYVYAQAVRAAAARPRDLPAAALWAGAR